MKACSPLMGGRSISNRPGWWCGAGGFVLALLCVLGIALLQRGGWLDGLNFGGMELAGGARDAGAAQWITPIMQVASVVGDTVCRFAIVGVVMAGLAWGGRARQGWWLGCVAVGGTLLNSGLKQVFSAPRPDLLPHLDIVNSFSFPSGHAAGNMILFGALAMIAARRSAYLLSGAMIVLIGVSRIWLGVHWPSDVLAGWVEGIGWLALWRCWLPARGREQQGVSEAAVRWHAIGSDEAVDPETVERGSHRDQ